MVDKKISLFLSATFCGKLIALIKLPSRGCSYLVVISQMSLLKQCRKSMLLKATNILMQPQFGPLISVSRNRHLTYMTNMLLETYVIGTLLSLESSNATMLNSAGEIVVK